ncbi:hypothetical protein C7B65_15410 [Phormidesmis priestleyi ULC007]|uniref:Uncharacterized protein n=2 Tax=Phormidesmis priestleyi TaxID=268141 RepID=A0A2T1DDB4_9CYAN|nr:hypothetical protein C7B65_15410 [Phormidesmis priestleyi ULC007]PZO48794.1 MAG: hypothetical protein DCF14_15780 [Phormidesmis priestleyi]
MGKTSGKGNKRKTLFAKGAVRRSEEKMSGARAEISVDRQRLLNQLVAFVQRYPVLVWSGVWVLLVLMIWLGVTGLLHVDTVEVEPPQPGIVTDAPQIPQLKPRLQAKPASSFGLLAAIAVSCGVTSLLLAKQFTSAKPQRGLVIKRQKAFADNAEIATHQPPQEVESKLAKQPPADAVFRRATPVKSQPTVTVLPAEENHPLDWGDASLADRMDIRKQKSLSNYL